MPQILVTNNKKNIINQLNELGAGNILIKIAEEIWPVAKGDITFTAIKSKIEINEADLQVEIRYSTGYEYGDDKVKFDPTKEDREKLADAIGKKIKELLPLLKDVSVWVIPYKDTTFKIY